MALISDYMLIGSGNRTSLDIGQRSSFSRGETFFSLTNRFTETISVVQSIEWKGLTETCAINAAAVGFAGGKLYVADIYDQGIFTLTRYRTYQVREDQRQVGSYDLVRNVETTIDIGYPGQPAPTISVGSSKRTYPFTTTITPRAGAALNAYWLLDLYSDAVSVASATWGGTATRTITVATPSILLAQSWISMENPGAIAWERYV